MSRRLNSGNAWFLVLSEEHRLRMFEKGVLRRITEPEMDQTTQDWRKLNNEKLHNIYSSPNIIRTIRYRRMRWARHGARIILKWFLEKYYERVGTGLIWLGTGISGRLL
jgi:hypothetical protein